MVKFTNFAINNAESGAISLCRVEASYVQSKKQPRSFYRRLESLREQESVAFRIYYLIIYFRAN